jgi:predicted metal-dependent phosphoesterase TrpH
VIDLHLHKTASDGRSSPEALVAEAAAADLRTIAITDHDTTDGVEPVSAAARPLGLEVVPGIEVTAVEDGRDIHVLGYFVDTANLAFQTFLEAQRADRHRRFLEMVAALERLGMRVDGAWPAASPGRRSLGRPLLAAALVDAGHVRDIAEAFDRFLADGRPAYVARRGPGPAAAIARIHEAGGLASLAHPGQTGLDGSVARLAAVGLDAVEVFHPDHDDAARARYRQLADESGLLITGGSDYHGPSSGRGVSLGQVRLPPAEFSRLAARAGWSSPRHDD